MKISNKFSLKSQLKYFGKNTGEEKRIEDTFERKLKSLPFGMIDSSFRIDMIPRFKEKIVLGKIYGKNMFME